MIQRSKKPIDKEIVVTTKPKKKVKLLNEFVGGNKLTNKLVNENNIVINIPEPVVKKKRKKKPKISDESKKKISETLKVLTIPLSFIGIAAKLIRKSPFSTNPFSLAI